MAPRSLFCSKHSFILKEFLYMYTVCVYFMTMYWQAIITLILATDMARHGEILDSFKLKVDSFDFTNEEHVTCVCTVHPPCQKHILNQSMMVCWSLYGRFKRGLGYILAVQTLETCLSKCYTSITAVWQDW